MKFINFAVVRFSLFLMIGIVVAHFFDLPFLFLKFFPALILILAFLWFMAQRKVVQNPLFGLFTYLCFFVLGYSAYQIRLPQFQSLHFENQSAVDKTGMLLLKIREVLKPDTYNSKYIAELDQRNGSKLKGKILLNIKKDSIPKNFRVDDILWVHSNISEISKALNPGSFDYSKYMKTIGVYGEIKTDKAHILKWFKGKKTLHGRAQQLREFLIERLKASNLKTEERSIVQALILGDKRDISKELFTSYAAAGAVHILAVSGLHVGILLYILTLLFKPLNSIRYGKIISGILILFCLWGFAVITGLSPSVTRAVTMFSFFAFATVVDRPTNPINTLFLSLLTLLIINPLWLFQVGFQLSYLAVFFIVWLQPIFSKMVYFENILIRKLWQIVTVTISAQIGVLPLSLYYFHQFPGLFLVTNIVVLPCLTLIMCGGLIVVLLAAINLLPEWLGSSFNYGIEWLNTFIKWIANQNAFLFRDIHFSISEVWISYFILCSLILILLRYSYFRLLMIFSGFAMFIGILIMESSQQSEEELILFHKTKKTFLAHRNARKLQLFQIDTIPKAENETFIKSYSVENNILQITENPLPHILKYNDRKILLLDSLGIYPKNVEIKTVIMINSPKVNLNRLLDSLNPKQVLADGSNYKSYIERWKNTCKKRKLPFHYTGTDGAFIFN